MNNPGPKTVYDGHFGLSGVDTLGDPSMIGSSFVSNAVNKAFRGGVMKTRPSIRSIRTIFDSDRTKSILQSGAINGVFGYKRWGKYTSSHVIVSVDGYLLKGRVYGNEIEFSVLFEGLNPTAVQGYFVQGEDRMYFQNGIDRPVGWDGLFPAYQVHDVDDAMPIGHAMVYAHGRLIVLTADNYAIISDHIYGNTLRNTRGLESFIEHQQTDDIGAIGVPADLGPVVCPSVMSSQPDRNAQGEVVVWCANGAYSLNITGERSTWLYGDIQKVVLVGRGCSSPSSIVPANNDLWYQSTDGISSYQFGRGSLNDSWGDTSLSREVSKYLAFTDPTRARFISGTRANNRLLMTAAISVERASSGGIHRFGEGIVSLDFDKGSTVVRRSGFSWDGLWTGPNVIGFCGTYTDSIFRNLCLSRDADGVNRVYEITDKDGPDIIDDVSRQIVSFHDTARLFSDTTPNAEPLLKQLLSARMMVSDVEDKITIDMMYRPGYSRAWSPMSPSSGISFGCGDLPDSYAETDGIKPIGPNWSPINSQTPSPNCDDSSGKMTTKSWSFTVRVKITGSAKVDFLSVSADIIRESSGASCEINCKFAEVDDDGLFDYKIV